MSLDIHAHMYPQRYVEFLERLGGESARLARHMDSRARTLSRWIVTGTTEEHVEFLDAAGIDRQVLSLSSPSVLVADPARCAQHAEAANDSIAEVCARFPERLFQFATLPLVDPDVALRELDRVRTQHGAVGVTVPTNVLGRPLDWEGLEPVYAALEASGLPMFIHPAGPNHRVAAEGYNAYGLASTVYFPAEDSNALLRLVHSGVLERHPNLRVICAHMGGLLPLWIWRAESLNDPGTSQAWDLPHPPSYYLRKVKYDSACANPHAIRCACETYGMTQVVLGTDYPCENMRDIMASVKAVGLTDTQLAGVLEDNLAEWIPVRERPRALVGAAG
jgi:aminocarboxymuconate-semialdehyde decarboxylase